ncbi:hypothetical protein [Microlunatus sp. GCM10028923]|uniref:hypothetical protein n=1 Tax=Microlunatus sp. GCM10028923 TaxID=3273400 RepID=UPI00360AD943
MGRSDAMIMIIRRAIVVLASVLTMVVLLAGCAGGRGRVEADPVFTTCHDYRAHTLFGRFTVQQEKKGGRIAWGAYPKEHLTGDLYTVKVILGGRKIGDKSQRYPPHGSIHPDQARKGSGKTLEITGKVTEGGKLVLAYTMRCRVL